MTISIHTIKEKFIKVIQHSQNFQQVHPDRLFERWYEAKKRYIDTWGGTIWEVSTPITFTLSTEEKQHRLSEFIHIVENTYNNIPLAEFLYDNKDDFFNNHLSKEYQTRRFGIIPKGTKIVRAFKIFEQDSRALTDLQNQASMIIQEDKVTGTLCFSVDPLDFLSTSENTYHWRSCHALDGEYRCGNLSYMMDEGTIICYLRGEKEVKLPNFPDDVLWNSKKWRMLLFLSTNRLAMMAGRQYPYFSPTALDVIQTEMLRQGLVSNACFWSPWYDDYMVDISRNNPRANYADTYLEGRCVFIQKRPYLMHDIVHDMKGSLHFNDLLHSSFYIPYYCWSHTSATNKDLNFKIGGQVPCLCCGERPLTHTDLMFCDECACEYGAGEDNYFRYCECCDRRFLSETGTYVEGLDGIICPECATEHTKECEDCADTWFTNELIYEPDSQQYLCPCCHEYRKANSGKQRRSNIVEWFNDLPF